ncbi:MAG: DUF4013 domain-containing protein [Methanoregula sp.]|nr:DUF4013 domain-containing protein [Methanoregula sp.]
MDFRAALSESFRFTRETLLGNRTRWPVLILLSLPMVLIRIFFGGENLPSELFSGTFTLWQYIERSAIPVLFSSLPGMFIHGYEARIYRGSTDPSGFGHPVQMFINGFRLWIVSFVWSVPVYVCVFLMIAGMFEAGVIGGHGAVNRDLVLLTLGLAVTVAILFIIIALFNTIGAIRYARTGSIREGLNYREILATIRKIGWGTYILSYLIVIAIALVTAVLVWAAICIGAILVILVSHNKNAILAIFPVIIWVIPSVFVPWIVVFWSRFITLVYDSGTPTPERIAHGGME